MTQDGLSDHPAILAAKEMGTENGVVTLSTGVRVRFKVVALELVEAVTSRIPEPTPPMWHNQEKDRDEPNLFHPDYARAVTDANRRRGLAALDASMLFGVELVDGMPEDATWTRRLKYLGIDVDETDPLQMELAYKKYVAFGSPDINVLQTAVGVLQVEVAKAEGTFPSSP